MAGMPPSLIQRANEILHQLEQSHAQAGASSSETSTTEKVKQISSPQVQLSIFDAHSQTFEEIRLLLNGIDINRLTPVEALLKLQEIKNKLQ
jgi:DNA mismatch repair protein MutS